MGTVIEEDKALAAKSDSCEPLSPGHGSKLGWKMADAVTAILTSRDYAEAAQKIGVSTRTLQRWMARPKFQDELQRARQRSIDGVLDRLNQTAGGAVDVLANLLSPGAYGKSCDKIRAAEVVLKFILQRRKGGSNDGRPEAGPRRPEAAANKAASL